MVNKRNLLKCLGAVTVGGLLPTTAMAIPNMPKTTFEQELAEYEVVLNEYFNTLVEVITPLIHVASGDESHDEFKSKILEYKISALDFNSKEAAIHAYNIHREIFITKKYEFKNSLKFDNPIQIRRMVSVKTLDPLIAFSVSFKG
jgi:hypothetical protein